MSVIQVQSVSKAFRIPTVRRETVREHVLGLLEPRRFERLQVLDRVSFEVRPAKRSASWAATAAARARC